jgi:hypothetical protein
MLEDPRFGRYLTSESSCDDDVSNLLTASQKRFDGCVRDATKRSTKITLNKVQDRPSINTVKVTLAIAPELGRSREDGIDMEELLGCREDSLW